MVLTFDLFIQFTASVQNTDIEFNVTNQYQVSDRMTRLSLDSDYGGTEIYINNCNSTQVSDTVTLCVEYAINKLGWLSIDNVKLVMDSLTLEVEPPYVDSLFSTLENKLKEPLITTLTRVTVDDYYTLSTDELSNDVTLHLIGNVYLQHDYGIVYIAKENIAEIFANHTGETVTVISNKIARYDRGYLYGDFTIIPSWDEVSTIRVKTLGVLNEEEKQ